MELQPGASAYRSNHRCPRLRFELHLTMPLARLGARMETTIDTRLYALDKWIYPFCEGRLLKNIG